MDKRHLYAVTHPYNGPHEDLLPYRLYHELGDRLMGCSIVAVDR